MKGLFFVIFFKFFLSIKAIFSLQLMKALIFVRFFCYKPIPITFRFFLSILHSNIQFTADEGSAFCNLFQILSILQSNIQSTADENSLFFVRFFLILFTLHSNIQFTADESSDICKILSFYPALQSSVYSP